MTLLRRFSSISFVKNIRKSNAKERAMTDDEGEENVR